MRPASRQVCERVSRLSVPRWEDFPEMGETVPWVEVLGWTWRRTWAEHHLLCFLTAWDESGCSCSFCYYFCTMMGWTLKLEATTNTLSSSILDQIFCHNMIKVTNKPSWGQCIVRQRDDQSFYVYFAIIPNDSQGTDPHPSILDPLHDLEVLSTCPLYRKKIQGFKELEHFSKLKDLLLRLKLCGGLKEKGSLKGGALLGDLAVLE